MMNFCPVELLTAGRVETIPLSHPMVTTTPTACIDIPRRRIARLQISRRCIAVSAMAHVVNVVVLLGKAHGCLIVGQLKDFARGSDSNGIGRIKAKEIDPRLANRGISPKYAR